MKYEITESGFVLHLDATIYARPAAMKAFYRFQERYIISYERAGNSLDVYFDICRTRHPDISEEIREIMAELSFQMIRYDTMRETSSLRELLVGRALYATCVDMGREAPADEKNEEEPESWLEDKQHIFDSWMEEA